MVEYEQSQRKKSRIGEKAVPVFVLRGAVCNKRGQLTAITKPSLTELTIFEAYMIVKAGERQDQDAGARLAKKR